MRNGLKLIYNGGYIPDLAVDVDKDSRYFGWLFFKHPDGQWVTVADIKAVAEQLNANNLLFKLSKKPGSGLLLQQPE